MAGSERLLHAAVCNAALRASHALSQMDCRAQLELIVGLCQSAVISSPHGNQLPHQHQCSMHGLLPGYLTLMSPGR